MSTSEERLLQCAVAGDADAITALLERYGPTVRRKLNGKIDQRWRSVLSEDDVMQETYADAFLGIAGFEMQGEGSFERWLTTLAQNNLRDAVKALRANKRGGDILTVSPTNEDSHVRLWESLAVSATSPSNRAARNEVRELLERAMQRLPETYCQVVTQYDLQGGNAELVAKMMCCSQGAVHMRRARAHAMLKEILGSESKYL